MSCKKNCDCFDKYVEKHGEEPKYGYPCLHPDEDLAKEMKQASESKIKSFASAIPQREKGPNEALIDKLKYRSNAAFRTSKANGGMAYWDGVAEAYDSVIRMLSDVSDTPLTGNADTGINCPSCGRWWNLSKNNACECGAILNLHSIEPPPIPQSENDGSEAYEKWLDKPGYKNPEHEMIQTIRRTTASLISKGPEACEKFLRDAGILEPEAVPENTDGWYERLKRELLSARSQRDALQAEISSLKELLANKEVPIDWEAKAEIELLRKNETGFRPETSILIARMKKTEGRFVEGDIVELIPGLIDVDYYRIHNPPPGNESAKFAYSSVDIIGARCPGLTPHQQEDRLKAHAIAFVMWVVKNASAFHWATTVTQFYEKYTADEANNLHKPISE